MNVMTKLTAYLQSTPHSRPEPVFQSPLPHQYFAQKRHILKTPIKKAQNLAL